MRNLIITISVLAIAALVYGKPDPGKLHKFYVDYAQCNEELGGTPAEPRVDTVHCALKKDPNLFNANGEFITEVAMKQFVDFISDDDKLKQAQAIWRKCHNEAIASGATGEEQTLKIISCSLEIKGLLDEEK